MDVLYSGLMLTAFMLSLWTAVLVTAACVFFAPAALGRVPGTTSNPSSSSAFEKAASSKLVTRRS
jgi:hypothetical protein